MELSVQWLNALPDAYTEFIADIFSLHPDIEKLLLLPRIELSTIESGRCLHLSACIFFNLD